MTLDHQQWGKLTNYSGVECNIMRLMNFEKMTWTHIS